ncbi:NAD-dependent epimerase/dehydratase family protein [Sphingobacterium yanglingense]|uniref:Nucleoside-diphosphate-sugar epimerase n=1 Tax=Sphingobacterium yanglingense TaxID=1437280 RepID=A0A4R6W9S8_9SPHI|nr:NAD-dependent epimerase/dehydratase family protein [Sphingobacterium yanglingense]TDQ73505.1 nucleoside-diphosphate-sugar epimerase [Sphingobacterium yanglingense]
MIGISGSSGFIGQNLLNSLHEAKCISLREKDWKILANNCDVLVNLVGKAHDHRGTATEQDYYYINLELTKEVFHVFKESSATLLIHVSSLAALEEFESSKPLTEADECHPNSWYGLSKRAAEIWLMKQKFSADKKIIILRPPMVHGSGDKGNLGLLYKLISKGIPYPLTSFNNSRSFISMDNFCYFIEQIILHQDKLDTGIYHIADDDAVSTKDIIEIIKKVSGKRVPTLALPKLLVKAIAKVGDKVPIPLNTPRLRKMTSDLLVSNEKIKQGLGIEKLPLTAKEGLEKTIKSFSERSE